MANSSSATAMAAAASLTFLLPAVTEKLTRGNYNIWHAQVSTALKDAQLARYIKSSAAPPAEFLLAETIADGKKANPQPIQIMTSG
jgi:hypothetical protein